MNDVAKRFRFLGLALSVLLLNVLFGSAAQAQDQESSAVVEVDFDDKKPEYSFGLSFGGYKVKGSEDLVSLNSKLSKTSKMLTDGGKEGRAFEATLDTSKAEVPPRDKLSFAYIGLGVGINGTLIDSDLSIFEVADFKLVFDAKIENGKPMRQSRVELEFVTSDGKGPIPDDDTEDDSLCKLSYAGSQSPVKVELTDEFQTVEVELADMKVVSGSIEQIQKYSARGVTLIVVAEDAPDRFSVGGQTKLVVDNYRLIKK